MEYKVDLAAFDAHYADDDLGARAYHLEVLLKIVLFAYVRGLVGSWRIERACRENLQFMALSAEAKPRTRDHRRLYQSVARGDPGRVRRSAVGV